MSKARNALTREVGLVCGWTFNVLAGFAAIIGLGYIGGHISDLSDAVVVGMFAAPFIFFGYALRYLFAGDIGWPFAKQAHQYTS